MTLAKDALEPVNRDQALVSPVTLLERFSHAPLQRHPLPPRAKKVAASVSSCSAGWLANAYGGPGRPSGGMWEKAWSSWILWAVVALAVLLAW